MSASADGGMKLWDSTSGQTVHELPAHMLGIPSLSVSPTGTRALYNTLEGLTCLWDLETGEVLGKHESFTRTAEQSEPGLCILLDDSSTSVS